MKKNEERKLHPDEFGVKISRAEMLKDLKERTFLFSSSGTQETAVAVYEVVNKMTLDVKNFKANFLRYEDHFYQVEYFMIGKFKEDPNIEITFRFGAFNGLFYMCPRVCIGLIYGGEDSLFIPQPFPKNKKNLIQKILNLESASLKDLPSSIDDKGEHIYCESVIINSVFPIINRKYDELIQIRGTYDNYKSEFVNHHLLGYLHFIDNKIRNKMLELKNNQKTVEI